jgi:hypothetical protein
MAAIASSGRLVVIGSASFWFGSHSIRQFCVTLGDARGRAYLGPWWLEYCVSIPLRGGRPCRPWRQAVHVSGLFGEAGEFVEFGLGDPGVVADARYVLGDLALRAVRGEAEDPLALSVGIVLRLRRRVGSRIRGSAGRLFGSLVRHWIGHALQLGRVWA